MDRDPVESTSIRSVGYDQESSTLEVEFIKGAVYAYSDVPEDAYLSLLASESIGAAFSKLVKSAGYEYERKT